MQQYLDPRIFKIFMDSCAFYPKPIGSPESVCSKKLLELYSDGSINLEIPHSVQTEMDHPNTPILEKILAQPLIFTYPTPRTPQELKQKADLLKLLSGNGKPENMESDAEHLMEAIKYGAKYFITNDVRIIKKASVLNTRYGIFIVTPCAFVKVLTSFNIET